LEEGGPGNPRTSRKGRGSPFPPWSPSWLPPSNQPRRVISMTATTSPQVILAAETEGP
jgi:hypothetical protein